MTLPASFPLSMSQIASELGLALPLSLNHAWVLKLAGKTALPMSFSDLLGKTGGYSGALTCSASQTGSSLTFPANTPLWGGKLTQLYQDATQGNLLTLSFSSYSGDAAPTWTGNFKITDTNTGLNATLTKQNATQWAAANSAILPGNNVTHTFTIYPA